MRILFTFVGGSGHFEPLVPIARACMLAGHIVAFAAQPAMIAVIEAAGFSAFATGGKTLLAPSARLPLMKVDMVQEERALRESFAKRFARERAALILDLCAVWQPDLLVCDEVDFGAMIAAERFRIPHATVFVIASGSFVRKDVVGEPLEALRVEYGLPPDPDFAMLSRYLVLSPFPPSYRDPAFPLPATAHSIRPHVVAAAPNHSAPEWNAHLPDAPTLYFTLGTIFNIESGDLFERVLTGLRQLPVNVVATLGREVDPQEVGPQPAHIHIARFIPQATVLPYCDLVVSHGGSGSVMGALAHGLPMVLLPMGADQPLNAQRCAALGVAYVLDALAATPEHVRDAVASVLADPAYRQAAEGLRDEITTLPDARYAVELLERLANEKQPILR